MSKYSIVFVLVVGVVAGVSLQTEPPVQDSLIADTVKKPAHKTAKVMALWTPVTRPSASFRKDPLDDVIDIAYIQAQPLEWAQLEQGQQVSFTIPQTQKNYHGKVETHYRQFGDKVSVSKGKLDGGDAFSSFTVTRGPETTLVMVATEDSVYQIEIDNQTGQGTVIDDRALDYFRKQDDSQLTSPEGLS